MLSLPAHVVCALLVWMSGGRFPCSVVVTCFLAVKVACVPIDVVIKAWYARFTLDARLFVVLRYPRCTIVFSTA